MRNWIIRKLGGYTESELIDSGKEGFQRVAQDEKDAQIEALTKRGVELQEALRLLMNDKSSKDYMNGYSEGMATIEAKYSDDIKELNHLRSWRDGWKNYIFPEFKP